jgi:hypothetical protein
VAGESGGEGVEQEGVWAVLYLAARCTVDTVWRGGSRWAAARDRSSGAVLQCFQAVVFWEGGGEWRQREEGRALFIRERPAYGAPGPARKKSGRQQLIG